MKQLYFDCSMGAAGDMILAALYELVEDRQAFLDEFAALRLPGVRLAPQEKQCAGLRGTHMQVLIDGREESPAHTHAHHHLADVQTLVRSLPVSGRVRADALAVYDRLADAEAAAHGVPVKQIHFHEVGQIDAVCDILGTCMLLERLDPVRISASAVHVGCGKVRCAHGLLDVPAPATANLLQGIPTYGGEVPGELCTPTGAALLAQFVAAFDVPAPERPLAAGYGFGTRELVRPNCLRAYLF